MSSAAGVTQPRRGWLSVPSHIGIVYGPALRSRGSIGSAGATMTGGAIRSGAIAVIGSGGGRLQLTTFDVFDMPLRRLVPSDVGRLRTQSGTRDTPLDLSRLTALLQIGATPAHATVQQPRVGRRDSAAAIFAHGAKHGALLGVLAALRIGVTSVYAAVWRRDVGVPAGGDQRSADAIRARASELFPDHANKWRRTRDCGRAEAALLAEWGRRQRLAGR